MALCVVLGSRLPMTTAEEARTRRDDTDPLAGIDLSALWARLRPRLRPTLILPAERLGAELHCDLYLACETHQHTGSFKYRAALGAALVATAPRLITASSGNFGAALARASAEVGRGALVVMPARSAQVKITATRAYGATVDLIDTERITRQARVAELAAADPQAQVVSAYDEAAVIAGNGSLGAELFADGALPGGPPELVISPVGGGGLSAGLCAARDLLMPGCQVLGAEPALGNDGARSLRAGVLLQNDAEPDTLCDGARTLSLGRRNFAILRRALAGIVEVEDRLVVQALRRLFVEVNLKVEPTGALAVAALLAQPERVRGRRVVCVISGGNVDAGLYARLLTEDL